MIKKVLSATSMLLCMQICFAQTYKIGHRQLLWVDSTRNNRQVLTELYYPADNNGEGVPVASGTMKFATLVFGHGYQLTYTNYLWLKDSLVRKGYFVAFPRTEEELFPSHNAFAQDLAYITKKMTTGNGKPAFFFYNRLNEKFAVSGHSMGGGCALLSVQYSSFITGVCPLEAAETDPSAISACSTITKPTLIFGGKRDCVTPPSTNQIPMYNALASSCKVYVEIKNAKHCHWAANGTLCTLGEFTCGGFATSPTATYRTTMSLLGPWLGALLYNRSSDVNTFQNVLQSSTAITYQAACTLNLLVPVSKNTIPAINALQVSPTIVSAGMQVSIQLPADMPFANASIHVSNSMGLIVWQQKINVGAKQLLIPAYAFNKGNYFIRIETGGKLYQAKFMVQ